MSNSSATSKPFSTSDLALSSALLCLGYQLREIQKTTPRAFFLFERTSELEGVAEMYWAGDLQVDPKKYFNCLKEIKTRLYGGA